MTNKIKNITSACAQPAIYTDGEKEAFILAIEDLTGQIPEREEIIISTDLNGHVGKTSEEFFNVLTCHTERN